MDDTWHEELEYALDAGMEVNLGAVLRSCGADNMLRYTALRLFVMKGRLIELNELLSEWSGTYLGQLASEATLALGDDPKNPQRLLILQLLLDKGAPVTKDCLEMALVSGDERIIRMFTSSAEKLQAPWYAPVLEYLGVLF